MDEQNSFSQWEAEVVCSWPMRLVKNWPIGINLEFLIWNAKLKITREHLLTPNTVRPQYQLETFRFWPHEWKIGNGDICEWGCQKGYCLGNITVLQSPVEVFIVRIWSYLPTCRNQCFQTIQYLYFHFWLVISPNSVSKLANYSFEYVTKEFSVSQDGRLLHFRDWFGSIFYEFTAIPSGI